MPYQPPDAGIIPWVGLNPTVPQQAAGMRIDPAPSEPVATGTAPAPTNAADPPDDPPLVRLPSCGLRVCPKVWEWVNPQIASSGNVVLATGTMPAAKSASMPGELARAGVWNALLPRPVTKPAIS